MIRSIHILFMLLLLCIAGCGSSGQIAEKPHEHLNYPPLKPLTLPEIERFSHNGIEFFLLQNKELPLININVRVYGGDILEPTEKTGLATLTGTVFRSGGSKTYPMEELNDLLEYRAARIETSYRSWSGLASLRMLSEDLDELLPVFTDFLKHPLFPQERLDLAKTQRRSSISRRNDSGASVANREFNKLIYGSDSPYARVIEHETINNITREDLVRFHQKTYQGKNMVVGVIGDFDPEIMKEKLIAAFDIFEEGERLELDFPEVNYTFEEQLHFAHKGDMNQVQIRLGHIGGYRDNPDFAALQVMNNVLSGGFTGRLMMEVRTRLGLAYGVGGRYRSYVNYPGTFHVMLSTGAENTKIALEATIREIKRLQNEVISEDELNTHMDILLNSTVFEYDSYSQILSQQISNYMLGLPEDAFEQYIEEVRHVTAEDVYRVANEYLRPDALKVLIVGNRDLIEDQLKQLGDYNEIDITIPMPGQASGPQEAAGDSELGRLWLNKMAAAIIHNNISMTTLTTEGNQAVNSPQGEVSLQTKRTITLPDQITLDISMPSGSLTIQVEGDSGTLYLNNQEQSLLSSDVESIRNESFRDPVIVAYHAENLPVYKTDSTESSVTLFVGGFCDAYVVISKETHLPVELRYEDFDHQSGDHVDTRVFFENWTEKNGIYYPYLVRVHTGDEDTSAITLTNHTIN